MQLAHLYPVRGWLGHWSGAHGQSGWGLPPPAPTRVLAHLGPGVLFAEKVGIEVGHLPLALVGEAPHELPVAHVVELLPVLLSLTALFKPPDGLRALLVSFAVPPGLSLPLNLPPPRPRQPGLAVPCRPRKGFHILSLQDSGLLLPLFRTPYLILAKRARSDAEALDFGSQNEMVGHSCKPAVSMGLPRLGAFVLQGPARYLRFHTVVCGAVLGLVLGSQPRCSL